VLDINLQVGPERDQNGGSQQHKPGERHWPSQRHAYLFAAQEGAVRTEQGQKTKCGRAQECQPNASDLRGGLIPCLANEIRGELAKTLTASRRAGLLWSPRSDEPPPPDAKHGGSLRAADLNRFPVEGMPVSPLQRSPESIAARWDGN